MKKLLLTTIIALLLSIASYSQTVCPPTITQLGFSITRPVTLNQKVGGATYCEPDANQIDTWSIVEAQTLWKIDQGGNILVADATAVNNSALTTFVFTIRITDNGSPILFNSATVTLTDVNTPPVIAPQTFNIAENTILGTTVGTIVASDPNAGQTLTYTIISGNTNNTFSLTTAGVLKVASNTALDFEATPTYSIVVRATDNGTGALFAQATMTVNVTNVNEAPVIKN